MHLFINLNKTQTSSRTLLVRSCYIVLLLYMYSVHYVVVMSYVATTAVLVHISNEFSEFCNMMIFIHSSRLPTKIHLHQCFTLVTLYYIFY